MAKYPFIILLLSFGIFLSFESMDPPGNKVELGKNLFFDPILSADSTISCASCHKPDFAFADNVAISPGVGGKMGIRNAPSVMNIASRSEFFYDGRASSLRDQIHFPIEDPAEMDLPYEEAVERVRRHPKYNLWFRQIYDEEPNTENLSDAIASYEESLETAQTDFDAWMMDRPNNFSEAAQRGRDIFMSDRAKCFDCHFGPDFTGDEFKNIGLYDEVTYTDKGRYKITKSVGDLGKFKVPGLRNVAVTAPYMHDGSFSTLSDVVEYYSNPYNFVEKPINIDTLLSEPLNLTEQEKSDLVTFLESLTDKSLIRQKTK